MNDFSAMTTVQIYQDLRMKHGYGARRVDRLVEAFHQAGLFLLDKIESSGWKWRNNYMREHAGCAFGAEFTNTCSPQINELVFRKLPELRRHADNDEHRSPSLFQ